MRTFKRSSVCTGVIVGGLCIALALTAAGCAKRPALALAAAPAPTVAQAAPPPTPPAPTPPPAAAAPPVAAPEPVVTARAAAPPSEYGANEALKRIHFDFDKSEIRKVDAPVLDAGARWLKDNPTHLVLVEGHCDPRGTNEYNMALGERRARAAMSYLVAQGISAGRFTLVSYGEERPLCNDETETCWATNRRAMFLTRPQ
ncbi:MAG TPA: peptidoglycan-associated lipoprotein Pal [Patescibacteria group bacterium]|nr:peptidoglycan-associated lipoprotein Pal [Patescibacteria group bacterium]